MESADHHDLVCLWPGEPSTGMFISPSVTPWRGRDAQGKGGIPRNPAVRKYMYSRSDYSLMDYEQYYLPLTKANTNTSTDWSRLYTFKQVYGSNSLHADQLQEAVELFKPYASQYFHKYYDYKYVGMRENYVPCDCQCKFDEICAMENVDRDSFEECVDGVTCSRGQGMGASGVLLLGLAGTLAALLTR